MGNEAAGVVEKLGSGVSGFAPGERVCYGGGEAGAYADRRNYPAARLMKMPAGVSDELAAATLFKGMTVEYLLNRCYRVQGRREGAVLRRRRRRRPARRAVGRHLARA